MKTVTLSPTYEVEIPREVREQLGLRPGAKLSVSRIGGRVELMPILEPSDLFGTMPDLPSFEREHEKDRDLG
ncbi:MAG: AbrB/MazE/SpoVT family DNA-binding domain-containing protein [Chthoniobacteraceae bacterium]